MEEDQEPTTTTPLLSQPSEPRNLRPSSSSRSIPRTRQSIFVITIIILSVFLIEIGDFMQRAPWLRILEDIVCNSYYRSIDSNSNPNPHYIDFSQPIPEDECKIAPVQAKLAMLKGWDLMFSCIPGILLAVPYGTWADSVGRKPVLFLALVGITLGLAWTQVVGYFHDVFDVRWFWAGNVFMIIGGGSSVVRSMIFTILSDVLSEDERAPVFFRVTAASLIATVVSVPLAWYLMKRSPWVPMLLGLGFIGFGTILTILLPETLSLSKEPHTVPDAQTAHPDQDLLDTSDEQSNSSAKKGIVAVLEKLEDARFVFASPALCTLAFTFLVQSLGGNSISLLLQLASKRFHWSLAGASFLIPIFSVTNFIFLVVILPTIYSVLSIKFNMSPRIKDLVTTRGSVLFLIFGAIGIAWAPAPAFLIFVTIIFALGSGFMSAVRSLMISLVQPSQVSRLNAVLAVIDTIGGLISGPFLSSTFSWGMNLGDPWTGMSFLASAFLYMIVAVPVWIIRLPSGELVDEA